MVVTTIGAMAGGTATVRHQLQPSNPGVFLVLTSIIPIALLRARQVLHRSGQGSRAMGDILIETGTARLASDGARLAFAIGLTPVAFLATFAGFRQTF